jgi:N-acetylglucosamine-6-phosphate deacetylase
MRTFITAARLFDGSGFLAEPLVEIEDGKVVSIARRGERSLPAGVTPIDFPAATLAPAFFDVHFHGARGHDVMEASPEAIAAIGGYLPACGTATYLATTVTAPLDITLRAIEALAKLIARPAQPGLARPIGIHLEGPFLSRAKCGVQPVEHLLTPSIATFDRMVDAGQGHVRLITIAPELEGAAELIAHAASRGVRVSLGHSNATTAETRRAVEAGAASATHTFNAMRPFDHREPGILGVALTEDRLYAELICDGIHTAPESVVLWFRAKGSSRAILITDSMSAAGMPNGEYFLGGFPVQVTDGRAMARGVLAGSVLNQGLALENFLRFTGARLDQALPLVTTNPAAMTGLDTGKLVLNATANLVALDGNGHLAATFIQGKRC